jgi:hypothetical protein
MHIPLDLGFDWSGLDPTPADVNLGAEGTTQLFPLGTIYETPWGRWRYYESGGTIGAGKLAGSEAFDGAHNNLTPTAAAIGAIEITTSDTITLVANEYVGGTMHVEAAATAGSGYAYNIIKHDAPASGATFTIDQPLAVALDASAELTLVKSNYKECIIHASPTVTNLSGVVRHASADGDFGWMQTKGHCSVLTDTVCLIGEPVIASVNVNGAVGPLLYADSSAVELVHVGRMVNTVANTEFGIIDLQLE